MTTADRRRPRAAAALAAALVLVVGACRADARSQPDDRDGPEPPPPDPACPFQDGTDFRTRAELTIEINLPGVAGPGQSTCEDGEWRYEALDVASEDDAGHAGDNFRRTFEVAGWERVADDGVQLIYRGPCSERMPCEATVTITATSPDDSMIDVVMTGRVEP